MTKVKQHFTWLPTNKGNWSNPLPDGKTVHKWDRYNYLDCEFEAEQDNLTNAPGSVVTDSTYPQGHVVANTGWKIVNNGKDSMLGSDYAKNKGDYAQEKGDYAQEVADHMAGAIEGLQGDVSQLGQKKINYDRIVDGTNMATITNNYYIRYSDGGGQSAGASSNFKIYDINASSVKKVRCYVGCNSDTPAAIAFYSYDRSKNTFLQSASVQMIDGTHWYEANVPDNTKIISISNRGATLENPVIQLYYIDDNYTILNRNEQATSEEIDSGNISLRAYQIGTQFEVEINGFDGSSPVYLYVLRENSLSSESKYSIIINKPGVYYFERTDYLCGLRLHKGACEDNVLNFTIKRVTGRQLGELFRLSPNYTLSKTAIDSSTPFDVGTLFKGYYDATSIFINDKAWVSYPFYYNNGYKIHFACSDFNTYYINILYIYLPTFDNDANNRYGCYEKRLTTSQDIEITRDVWAWRITVRRQDRDTSITIDDVTSAVTLTYVSGDIYDKTLNEKELKSIIGNYDIPAISTIANKAKSKADQGYGLSVWTDKPYYYHYSASSFIKDGDGNNAIASESIEDVEMAARLGFSFIEANIHPTSDGHFVCIHGSGGKFSDEVKSIDPNVISTEDLQETDINSVTLDWIKSYVRYDSYYTKYQTTIPSLEEFCKACKENNIGIFAGTDSPEAAAICRKYMNNNIIFYNAPSSLRESYTGWMLRWYNKDTYTPESLLETARIYGAPYICALGPQTISAFELAENLDSFIASMHDEGFAVAFAAVYQTEETSRDLFRRGFDCSGAGHEINPFEANYEVFTLDDDSHIPTITGVGSITDGVASLNSGAYMTCGSSDVIALGKGSLTVRFNGTLTIKFGSKGDSGRTITSDGTEAIVITDYFFKRNTVLKVTADTSTTISNFVYKTSRC